MKTPSPPAERNPDFFSAQVSRERRFYLNLKPSPKTRLAVLCGGVEHCAANYAISRRFFPFYAFEFVSHGSGRLKLKGREHPLQPGSVFSYGPGIAHDISTELRSPLVKYFVDFTGPDATRLLTATRLKPGTVTSVFPPGEIQPLFEELIRNGRRGTPGSHEICVGLLRGLALKILDARAPLPGRDTLAFSTYQQCREHIQNNFLKLRSIEQVAAECHLDNTYLCRLFQRYDHQSPYRWLVRLKMNYAAERLQVPGTLVKQVAEEAGFANQFHFSRVFKSVFGLSPRAMIQLR